MLLYQDDEGFSTLCGITEACSDNFFEDYNSRVSYGDEQNTTCKRCLLKWEREKLEIDEILAEFERMVENNPALNLGSNTEDHILHNLV